MTNEQLAEIEARAANPYYALKDIPALIGYIRQLEAERLPTEERIHAQRPLPAAGPWIKLEPGCEIPNYDVNCIGIQNGRLKLVYFDLGSWRHLHNGDPVVGLTHYAVIYPPK